MGTVKQNDMLRCENCDKPEVFGYSIDDVPLCKECGEGLEKDEEKIQEKRKDKSDFWFYKKGRKHYAIQMEMKIKDLTEGTLIPIDNFNFQIEVGLIEDIGVE